MSAGVGRELSGAESGGSVQGEALREIEQTALRQGRRKAQAVARDMLRQRGVDDAAAGRLLARWTRLWEAPDAEQAEPDGEVDVECMESDGEPDAEHAEPDGALGAECAQPGELDGLRSRCRALERQMAAVAMGVPAERAARYVRLAEGYPGAEEDFGAAMQAALEEFPPGGQGCGALPSFAAKTCAPREDEVLTRAQIEGMSPRELTAHWGEVERFLAAEQKERA